tara:strand:+ start:77 stop:751 length:675 start_codon:yes stop_codon:yes gene_type:complete
MITKKIYLYLICLLCLSFGLADKIAIATKVKGVVEIAPTKINKFKTLTPGTVLSDGDKIRTGSKGFTAIIFIDDKSTLKVKENSEIVVGGQKSVARISKKINMDVGTIRATINKQNTDFVIQTPTSVASVKGTDFWLLSDPEIGDQVMGLEGVVGLTNTQTGQEVNVTSGMSGLSTPDGDLSLEETVDSTIPDDPSTDSESTSEIKIFMEGPNGQQKVIIIEYQ